MQGRLTHGKGRKGANYANLIAGLGKCHVCQGALFLQRAANGAAGPFVDSVIIGSDFRTIEWRNGFSRCRLW